MPWCVPDIRQRHERGDPGAECGGQPFRLQTHFKLERDGPFRRCGPLCGAGLSGNDAGLATNSIFFCFLFCEKSLICLEGKSMTLHRGNTILLRSSQQLPRLRLGPSKGFLS